MPNERKGGGDAFKFFGFFRPPGPYYNPRLLFLSSYQTLYHKGVQTTEMCSVYMSFKLLLNTDIAFSIDEHNAMSSYF